MVKTKIIVNPMARKGNCGRRWPQIRAELENQLGLLQSIDVVMTQRPEHATSLAREAIGLGYRRLISVGGDGTFHEILNGVIADDVLIAPDVVMAQIPAGTSNELSRNFNQHALVDAVRAVSSGHTSAIDIFRAEATSSSGHSVVRYGFIFAIVGAAATISSRANQLPLLKRLGPMSYVIMTAITALSYSPRQYRIAVDGEAEQSMPLWGALLCSFAGAGKGLMLAPGASPSDGKFDLVTLGDLGRWESLAKIVPNLGDGSYLGHAKIGRRLASRVTFSSDRQVLADVDGEYIGHLPMTVRLLPYRLHVATLAEPVRAAA
jgi:diacylglycerol kinase (ATP)